MKISVRQAEWKDIFWVASHLRLEDRREVETVSGQHAIYGLFSSLRKGGNYYTRAAFIGDSKKPCALFGLSLAGGIAAPWMVCTPDIMQAPLAILKESKKYVAMYNRSYTRLENYADSRNPLHLKWIRLMGFQLGRRVEYNGVLFQHFWKER